MVDLALSVVVRLHLRHSIAQGITWMGRIIDLRITFSFLPEEKSLLTLNRPHKLADRALADY